MCLTGVFQDFDSVPAGDCSDQFHFGHLSVQVNGKQKARPRGDRTLDRSDVHAVIVLRDVDEDRHASGVNHGLRSGDEGCRRKDDLIARIEAGGHKAQDDRVQAARKAHAVLGAGKCGELALERLDLGPVRELPGLKDPCNGREKLVAQIGMDAIEVDEGDCFGSEGGGHECRCCAERRLVTNDAPDRVFPPLRVSRADLSDERGFHRFDAALDSLRRPSYPVAMPSILDLARYADVSAENVLRVLNGEPVSVEVAERVRDAVDALGKPRWPGLPDDEEDADEVALEVIDSEEMFDARLPFDVGGLVYEAVRVEVRPVNENIQAMHLLVDRLVSTLERMGGSIEHERQERLEDVALVTELVVNGWRSVDRRLGRLERMLERQQRSQPGEKAVRHVHIDPGA